MLKKDLMLTIDVLGELSDRPITTKQIAKRINTSYYYVGKILKKLKERGWVLSKNGRNGGVYCVPLFLSLRDIIELWQGVKPLASRPSRSSIAEEAWLIAAEQIPIRTFGG